MAFEPPFHGFSCRPVAITSRKCKPCCLYVYVLENISLHLPSGVKRTYFNCSSYRKWVFMWEHPLNCFRLEFRPFWACDFQATKELDPRLFKQIGSNSPGFRRCSIHSAWPERGQMPSHSLPNQLPRRNSST